MGRIEGEVYEELSRLMVAMWYYDLGLCFLSLANLSEIQVYSDDTLLKNNKDNFDKLKKVVEYQYKGNKSEKLAKEEEEERERLRELVKKLVGENAKYGGRLEIKLVFRMQNIHKLIEGERFALKLVSPKGMRWISKELLNIELKNYIIYIEEKEIKEDQSGDRFKRFYYEYCLIENEMQQTE